METIKTASTLILRLYVANSAPNSLLAIANLAIICDEYLHGNYTLEIIDVLDEPQRALADGILVTPSLAKLLPLPERKIVGNLSDKVVVRRMLGIE
jgi:circadian clock protein KaiB